MGQKRTLLNQRRQGRPVGPVAKMRRLFPVSQKDRMAGRGLSMLSKMHLLVARMQFEAKQKALEEASA